ncbi:MAG: hypothetical protein O2865_11880 [Planctomycetota bacterium]|nr:hypothetical protein [Planctomycetota bacterium]MDA0934903.1 hypothetical protein [Planctomycetota bacterium]MDA1222337.1 hypothetical protein [Planctomycetota bacterium]
MVDHSLPQTFRERIERFLAELEEAGPAIRSAFEQGEPEEAAPAVQAAVGRLGPELAWRLCPGRGEERLGLALSAEGNRHLRLLTGWAVDQQDEAGGLDLFPSKPASPLDGDWVLGIQGHRLDAEEFRASAQIDPAHGAVDVQLHHPGFSDCEERTRTWAALLWLDEALGEDLVMRGVGSVETSTEPAGEDAVDAVQLVARVRALIQEIGGDPDQGPNRAHHMVRIPEESAQEGRFRADARFGTTRFLPVLGLWLDEDARDPLTPYGAGYAAVGFPLDRLEEGRAADQRGEVEDAIEEALAARGAGTVLGGMFGPHRAYVDILAVDADRAEDAVRAALAGSPRVGEAEMIFLADRDRSIRVK